LGEDRKMFVQVFFNWDGSVSEFETVKSMVMKIIRARNTVELVGLYVPSSEWNFTVIYDVESLDEFLMYQREIRAQLRTQNLDKISARKLELLIPEREIYK
jgi:hypothetical protein